MKIFRKLLIVGITLSVAFLVGCSDSKKIEMLNATIERAQELRHEQEKEIRTLKSRISSLEEENARLQKEIHDATSVSKSTGENDNINVSLYEFTDEKGLVWKLDVKSDKTARLNEKGSKKEFYGSWKKDLYQFSNMRGSISISFSSEEPPINFKSGKKVVYSLDIYDGYIYNGPSACEARDPSQRLKIIKKQ